jgi:hypothetical protein
MKSKKTIEIEISMLERDITYANRDIVNGSEEHKTLVNSKEAQIEILKWVLGLK